MSEDEIIEWFEQLFAELADLKYEAPFYLGRLTEKGKLYIIDWDKLLEKLNEEKKKLLALVTHHV